MFEIGFSEICMVALVALLVIGPEKLPQVARIAGFWIGKTRRMMADVQAELKHELYIEEFRNALNNQTDSEALHDLQADLIDTENAIHSALKTSATANPDKLDEQH